MIDWDSWRARYAHMSYAEHVEFYDTVAAAHPSQQHYPLAVLAPWLRQVQGGVVELGGWRGELARDILAATPTITGWHNHEVCRWAATNPATTDPRYTATVDDCWLWEQGPLTGAMFVASHALEHLSDAHVAALVAQLRTHQVLVCSPLEHAGQTWGAYHGSHMLQLGWEGLGELLGRQGYTLVWGNGVAGMYSNGCRLWQRTP